MTKPIVLSLFDRSANMLRPWVGTGRHLIAVDIQHEPGSCVRDGIEYVGADILAYMPPNGHYEAVFAFPPCTDLAVSGARWFRHKGLRRLADAIHLFGRAVEIAEWSGAPYFIENPVSVISSHYRKPDCTFQPWNYGDLRSKKTCLWTGGGFTMPPFLHTSKPDGVVNECHNMAPSPDRADRRSETSMAFAEAVFRHMNEPT